MECDCIALPGELISMVASKSGRGPSRGNSNIGSPFRLLPNVPATPNFFTTEKVNLPIKSGFKN